MVGLTPVCMVKAFGTGPKDDEGYLRTEIWFDPVLSKCTDKMFNDAAVKVAKNSGGKFYLDISAMDIGKITVERNPTVAGTDYYKLDSAVNMVTKIITDSSW